MTPEGRPAGWFVAVVVEDRLAGFFQFDVQDVLLRLVPLCVIAFSDGHRAVSECPAYFADVYTGLEQFHGESVPEHMRGSCDSCLLENLTIHLVNRTHCALRRGLAGNKEARGVAILELQ